MGMMTEYYHYIFTTLVSGRKDTKEDVSSAVPCSLFVRVRGQRW